MHDILHHHLKSPHLTGVQPLIYPSLDLTRIGDVSSALEGHHLEDDENRGRVVLAEAEEAPGRRRGWIYVFEVI